MRCFPCMVTDVDTPAVTVYDGQAMCQHHVDYYVQLRRRVLGEVAASEATRRA